MAKEDVFQLQVKKNMLKEPLGFVSHALMYMKSYQILTELQTTAILIKQLQ